jgi:hypothetical protein
LEGEPGLANLFSFICADQCPLDRGVDVFEECDDGVLLHDRSSGRRAAPVVASHPIRVIEMFGMRQIGSSLVRTCRLRVGAERDVAGCGTGPLAAWTEPSIRSHLGSGGVCVSAVRVAPGVIRIEVGDRL